MKEIEIIGKAIEPISSSKTVTTAEFVSMIEMIQDSFKTKIIPDAKALLDIIDDNCQLDRTESIITESNDMIKELERIKKIAIKYS